MRQRVEINAPLERLPTADDPLPPSIAAALAGAGLPLLAWPPWASRAVIERTAVDLEVPGCRAELAIDHGRVEAGGRQSAVRELELELRAGEAGGLVDAATLLAGRLGVRPGGWSKAARGMALLGWLRPPILRASPTLLDRFENLVDLEDRLRLGEDRWLEARREAIDALLRAGAPRELADGSGALTATRLQIDSPTHAALLWGLFVGAVRAGRQ